jgi:hypothetical protein
MTEEERKDLEYHGAQFTPTEELAIMLGIQPDELRDELVAARTERSKAILAGRFARKTALRESILDMACRGSSPAQSEALRMMKNL